MTNLPESPTSTRFKKGNIPWTKGRPRPKDVRLKISAALKGKRTGEDSYQWKGDNVGYVSLHIWVSKNLGKPTTCELCGKEGLTGKKIHWASKSREYRRDLNDWIRLCWSCHQKYDKTWLKRNRDEFGRFTN